MIYYCILHHALRKHTPYDHTKKHLFSIYRTLIIAPLLENVSCIGAFIGVNTVFFLNRRCRYKLTLTFLLYILSDLNVVNAGDRIWWTWELDKIQDVFSILQVRHFIWSDSVNFSNFVHASCWLL